MFGYRFLVLLVAIPILLFLLGYFLIGLLVSPPGRLVFKEKSPTGAYTVMVEEKSGGLAHFDDGKWEDSIFIYSNYIGIKTEVCTVLAASKGDGTAGVDVSWKAPDVLKLRYFTSSPNLPSNKSVWTGLGFVKVETDARLPVPTEEAGTSKI